MGDLIDPTDPHRRQINRIRLFVYVDRAFWAACISGGWDVGLTAYEQHG
jgi:hypothetical protein